VLGSGANGSGPGIPEFGSTFRSRAASPVVPSRMSMNQRVSLYCWESALSPVRMVRSSGALVTGDTALRAWRTIASVIWVVSDSCGRYAAENG
jgi:hypothetical protein